jgi:hypothetical protein
MNASESIFIHVLYIKQSIAKTQMLTKHITKKPFRKRELMFY